MKRPKGRKNSPCGNFSVSFDDETAGGEKRHGAGFASTKAPVAAEKKEFNNTDRLHPNDAGYKAMAGSIDLKIFTLKK